MESRLHQVFGSYEELQAKENGRNNMNNGMNSGKKYPEYCKTITVKDSHGGIKELVFPKALDLDRPKRARTTFSADQLYHLEKEFQRNQYLVGKERTQLAKELRLSETQVKVWFQNRRTKYKRDRCREVEGIDTKNESMAACNILRLLQNQGPKIPCSAYLPPYPYGGTQGCGQNSFSVNSNYMYDF